MKSTILVPLFISLIFIYLILFSDCKKVQEIRRKVEKMLSFFSYELISPPSKENDPISSLLYENNETLKKINNLISVLGNLSMFYTYNTNWANNSIPGYCQNESDVVVDTLKNQSQHKNALVSAGTYTFHLSMPYTHEVCRISKSQIRAFLLLKL